jgi:hypothetical protein
VKSINYVLYLVIFAGTPTGKQLMRIGKLVKNPTSASALCFDIYAKLSMRVPANMFLDRKTAGHNPEVHNMNLHTQNPSNITNSVVHYAVSIFPANFFFLRPILNSIFSKTLGLCSLSERDQVSYVYKTAVNS